MMMRGWKSDWNNRRTIEEIAASRRYYYLSFFSWSESLPPSLHPSLLRSSIRSSIFPVFVSSSRLNFVHSCDAFAFSLKRRSEMRIKVEDVNGVTLQIHRWEGRTMDDTWNEVTGESECDRVGRQDTYALSFYPIEYSCLISHCGNKVSDTGRSSTMEKQMKEGRKR